VVLIVHITPPKRYFEIQIFLNMRSVNTGSYGKMMIMMVMIIINCKYMFTAQVDTLLVD
jgi:hypothetical protein